MIASLYRSAAVLVLAAAIIAAPVAPVYGQSQSDGQQPTPQQPTPPSPPTGQQTPPSTSPSQTVPSSSQTQPQTGQTPTPAGYNLLMSSPDYSRGRRQFPNFFAPYASITVPRPELTDSPRIDQLIHEGKMELTLQDAITLALENNLDIAVQRYTPFIAETDILRTQGGGPGRGLAGTGTASVLGAIPAETFDPIVSSTLSWDRRSFPVNNPLTAGTGVGAGALNALTNYTTLGNFGVTQGFHTGTAYAIGFNNTRASTTSPVTLFNPSVSSNLFFSFSQQLLNGFGLLPNTRFIRIAKNNKKIADLAFSQQVITTVVQVADFYWELVFAREDVKVKQRALDVAQKLYNDNKRQVEIGTLAPIEVVRAEAEVARTRQDLIVSQTLQLQQETLLKNAITKSPIEPALLTVEVIPTDVVTLPPQIELLPLQDAVREALQKRPDVREQEIDVKNRDINVRATRNALLPTATLLAQYGAFGLGGNARISGVPVTTAGVPVVDANGKPIPGFFLPATQTPVTGIATGGLGDALSSIFHNNFPEYAVQLNLSIPIRNRPAQADNARAQLEERQSQTRLRQVQNGVVVEVRNAQIALEQNRARVEAAQKSRILQEQTLDAEQKKFQLGASTIFFVIQAERDLATAQSVEVRALVDLAKSQIDFERALGRTLEVNRINITDAKHGQVPRDTLIPGTLNGQVVGARAKF